MSRRPAEKQGKKGLDGETHLITGERMCECSDRSTASRPGLFDLPLQIYDLSVGGCFVNSVHEAPQKGQVFPIHIDLPNGETFVAKGEMALRATRLRIRREILSDLRRESPPT